MIIENLNLSFGPQIVFANCNLRLDDNCKVGLIGINGAGKTTLFRLITKEILPDSGQILLNKHSRLGYLPQTIDLTNFGDLTAIEYIKQGRPIDVLEKRASELETIMESCNKEDLKKYLDKYTKVINLLDFWDRYETDTIIKKIVSGMNIPENILNLHIKNLSGGEKSKVAFARLLYSKPNVLLLDEPTNHLDKVGRDWCIDYLKKYKGQLLIISHDYQFLNEIVDKILYIDKQKHNMSLFNGNYNQFVKIYEELRTANERVVKKQEAEEKKLQRIIDSLIGVSGKRKKMAFSKEKALERLQAEKVEKMHDDRIAKVKLVAYADHNKVPLEIRNLNFSYNKKPLLNNISFSVGAGERILIAGNNGVGKSTLLKLIMKELTPDSGEIRIGSKTRFAYYDQEQKEVNSTDKTILEYFQDTNVSTKQTRGVLSRYLFSGDQLYKSIKILSPGEKCRLSFSKLSLKSSNFMVLDEPTNHLDAQTQKVIAENLNEFDGNILLVSHNPDFVESLSIDKMLILPAGKMYNYDRAKLEEIQRHNESYNNGIEK